MLMMKVLLMQTLACFFVLMGLTDCSSTFLHSTTAASDPFVNQNIFYHCIIPLPVPWTVARITDVEDESITEEEASVLYHPNVSESNFLTNIQDKIIAPYLTSNQACSFLALKSPCALIPWI